MCGRTACTLAPDDIVRACTFRSRQGKRRRPVWKDPPGGQQYYPCYNVAPAAHTPVLISSRHYPGELESFSERVVQPMKWGLVPFWHKGDPYKLEYETNNCRAEGMLSKRTYKTPLEKGHRCVVLADGFFEWKRGPQGKQPYFIYFPQKSSDSKPDPHGADRSAVAPDLCQASSGKTPVKQEPRDAKPECQKPDLQPSTGVQIKQELVYKSDSWEPGLKSSTQTEVKQEPADIKTEPAKFEAKSGTLTRVKLEPVYVKPDSDAVPEGVQKHVGNGNCSPIAEGSLALSRSGTVVKKDCTAGKMLENEEDKSLGSFGNTTKETDQTADADDEEFEWQGKRLLTMAGVFDVWHPPDGSAPLYSYSVITVESSPAMSGIHHRMPAILSTEEEVRAWLEFAEVPLAQAVKVIRPTEVLTMHMVSPVVNNSRNKSPECVQVYNPKQVKRTASSNLMMNWLSKASPSKNSNPGVSQAKKQKLN